MRKINMRKCECPICKGTGKIEVPINRDLKKQAIFTLYKEGYGIRQIQRLLGFKSPQSVSFILNQK
jgi:transposase-like protein